MGGDVGLLLFVGSQQLSLTSQSQYSYSLQINQSMPIRNSFNRRAKLIGRLRDIYRMLSYPVVADSVRGRFRGGTGTGSESDRSWLTEIIGRG